MNKLNKEAEIFLSRYDAKVYNNAMALREIIFANLPDIIEQIDHSANMIAYCYSQKYADLICVLIPSKKGLKLGFNRGTSFLTLKNYWKAQEKFQGMSRSNLLNNYHHRQFSNSYNRDINSINW